MNNLVNEELNKMKYLLGYQKGKVISEQSSTASPAATVDDVIKQIQTTLNSKYGTNLTVDGKWGNLTQTAFETAVKSKAAAGTPAPAAAGTPAPAAAGTPAPAAAGTPAPAAAGTPAPAAAGTPAPAAAGTPAPAAAGTPAPAAAGTPAPAAAGTPAPATQSPDEIMGTEVAPQSNRDQRRTRQDLRRGNRRAMQDLRGQQRAQ
jgi:hypothetical protein